MFRMEKPAQCSTEVYLLMRDCWNFYPNQRPTFQELSEDLQQILKVDTVAFAMNAVSIESSVGNR